MAVITHELQHTVETHPSISEVHFTADGHHHFRAFRPTDGKGLYTRLKEVPETTKSGLVVPNKFMHVPIKDASGKKDDERFVIVESISREKVLSATPVNKPAPSGITKADILGVLEVSEEDLSAFLSKKKK